MTLKAYARIGDSIVEVPEEWILLPMDKGLSENADGSQGRGGVLIDDPAGDADIENWVPFNVEEDACDVPRLFTGYIWNQTVSRGPYRDGPSRQWDCDLVDLNVLLHFHILRGADANRPQETGSQRLAWLLTTQGLDGVVFDNGNVMANAWIYGPTDYRDNKYADDVLRDIVSASTDDRWTFFLYYDESAAAGEEVSLFYGKTTEAIYDSPLRISNVIADQDGDTFYPFVDASLKRDVSGQYGGVLVTGTFGRMYRTNATTIAGMGFTRDGTYTSDRLINTATAESHAAGFLAWHANPVDLINVVVELPRTRVNHVLPGHRIEVKFSHLDGYEAFTWTRVQMRTILGLNADRTMYRVALELSLKGILQSGGGDPGDFPAPGETEPGVTITACNSVTVDGIRNVAVSGGAGMLGADETWYYRVTNTVHDALSVTNGLVLKRSDAVVLLTLTTGVPPQVILDPGPATFFPYPTTEGSFTSPSSGAYPLGFSWECSSDYGTGNPILNECWRIELWKDNPPETPPPATGQWVGISTPEYVTMVGTSGTTAFPFADGSLRVFYDNVDQTAAIVSYDGEAGTFVMAGAPLPGWQVRVEYQGR